MHWYSVLVNEKILRIVECVIRGGSRGGSLGADEPPFEPTVPIILEGGADTHINRRWLADARGDGRRRAVSVIIDGRVQNT